MRADTTEAAIKRPRDKGWLDRVAIGLSGVCLVHCIATTVIVMVVASAGGVLLHPAVHEIGLVMAIGLAAVALCRGWLRHRSVLPMAIGGSGLCLMALALTVEHGAGETVLTILGVGIVALGHHLNRRALG